MHKTVTLDQADLKLLAALQADGRLTNQQLAETIGLSPSQCSRRRQRLEESGLIRAYGARIDRERLGFGLTAYVNVMLDTHNRDNARRFAELVVRMPNVLEAHSLTGEMDYLLKIVARDLKQLSAIINDDLLHHDTVRTVKDHAPVPLA
jgi:DNA-binding Lrp family transcriptional regulator